MTGIIYDIKKFSIHDGPGLRTTVFFKGCPLHCWWCHNPESCARRPEVLYTRDKCIGCGDCVAVCPEEAIEVKKEADRVLFLTIRERCIGCGSCVEVCPTGARELAGRKVAVQEVMEELEQDVLFYDQSGGGVTFSGGEPLMQPDFLKKLLIRCREHELHTALDTSGFAPTDVLLDIAQHTQLFLYDLKLMDDERHREYTGVSNELILENLEELTRVHNHVIIRVPIIPGINDDEQNLRQLAEFLTELGDSKQLALLPYHRAGSAKYERLGREYPLPDVQPPSAERMEELARRFKELGHDVKVGG